MDLNTNNGRERSILSAERREAILSRLMQILSQRHGLQSVVDYGYDLLGGNAVSVTDTAMKLLARSSQAQLDDPVLREQERSGLLSERTVEAFRHDRQLERLQSAHHAYRIHFSPDPERGLADVPGGMVIAPIRVGTTLVGYISAVGLTAELPPATEETIDLLAQASSIELQKNEFFVNTRGIAYEALLNDLLEGRAADREQVERRFRMLGRSLRDDFYVLVVSSEGQGQDDLARSVSQATVRTFFPNASSTVYRQDIVVFASTAAGSGLPDARHDLLAFLSRHGLRIGVAGPFGDITRTPEQYGLACEALRLGRVLLSEQLVVHFDEVSRFMMLEAAGKRVDLKLLCVPKLYELWMADRHSDREMIRTLFCYVRHAKSVEQASEELHVHRNTLFYRIKRMASLANLDLDDGADLARILLTEDVIRYRAHFG